MKKFKLNLILSTLALVAMLLVSGCGENNEDPTPTSEVILTANAGIDQTVSLGDIVTLDGSTSTSSDGSTFSYLWSVANAPAGSTATVDNATSEVATFTPDEPGTYTILLTVANQATSDTDEITIIVEQTNQAQEIGGTIDTDTTLEDLFSDPNVPDYIVTSRIDLSAILTVDPGVVVYVNEDIRININSGGVLDANGTASNGVVFTSANIDGGQLWQGILVLSSDQRNSIEYTEVSYAGNSEMPFGSGTDYKTNIGLDNGGFMNISNSTISNGGGYGLFVHDDESDLGTFSENAFEDNLTGIGLNALHVSKLDANTTFTNNVNEKVQILGSDLPATETVNWPALNGSGAFYVSGNIDIFGNLTIGEGAIFEMAENVTLYVAANAQLVASGSSGNEIVFTSNNISGGIKWQALAFRSSNTNNLLNFVEVSHAGNTEYPFGSGTDYKTNIALDDGGFVHITNSIISNGDGYGILIHDNESSLGDFNNNDINNNQTGVGLLANHVEALDATTVFSGNSLTQVEIFGSTFESTKTSTWNGLSGTAKYTITGNIGIDGNLTIGTGAYFESTEGVLLRVDGSIDFNGASGNEITFTSTSGVKWDGILISSSNTNNNMDYVIIDRGGFEEMPFPGTNYFCNLGVEENSFLTISNCTITNSDGYGVAVDQNGGATFSESGTTYSGNASGTVLYD